MSTYTENLNLFKYDTSIDGKQVFSIDQAMNENWDKIDSQVTKIDTFNDAINELKNTKLDKIPISAYITKTSSGSSWYRIYSDGFCEQGGIVSTTASSYTVTLPISYNDSNYTILAIAYSNDKDAGGVGATECPSKAFTTQSTFYISHYNPGNMRGFYWYCQGYTNIQ